MAPGPHCIRTAHDLAARSPAGRRVRDLRRQRGADALLFGVPRRVPRGVPVEPRRDVAGVLDVRARGRRERAPRRRAGGPPRPSPPGPGVSQSASPPGEGVGAARPMRRDWTLAEAIATPHFWLLFTVYLCTGLGSFFVSLHQLAFAVDAGFDKLYAASVLGFGAFLAVGGTIVTGTVSDYIGRELSAILAYAVSIVGVICALFITGPQHAWLLWLHACFFGLTWGARGPTITAKTADLFPGPNLGTILGVITVGTGIGSAVGAWGAGWIFDVSGSYRLAFLASIASYLVGCIAFWALRRPPTRQVV